MKSINRIDLKLDARNELNKHYRFYLLLSILWLAAAVLGNAISQHHDMSWSISNAATTMDTYHMNFGLVAFGGLFTLVAAALKSGAQFTMIDLDRNEIAYDRPFNRVFALFDKGQVFIGWILISILMTIFTFLWSLLLVFPGIIKSYSYSQAIFIYRDAINRGENMGFLEAITKSREMMDGHKWFLFVFDLSFILWGLLVLITVGLAGLWVVPYYTLARVKFYNRLRDEQAAASAATPTDAPVIEQPKSDDPQD